MPSKTQASLWIVLFIIFLDWMGIGIVYPMFSTMLFSTEGPLYDPNCSESARGCYLGILLAAMPLAQFFSGPILGALSDQKGRKPLFIASLLLAVIAYGFSTLGVLTQSIFVLIASRFLIGIASGNVAIVSATIADLSTPQNKSKHFGLYSMACGIGFTIGPLVGGKLSEISFELPFIVAGAATLLNLFLLFFLFSETHNARSKASIRFDEGIRNLKKAFQIQGLKATFITVLLFCFGWSFFFEFLPVTWIFDYQLNRIILCLWRWILRTKLRPANPPDCKSLSQRRNSLLFTDLFKHCIRAQPPPIRKTLGMDLPPDHQLLKRFDLPHFNNHGLKLGNRRDAR